MIRKRMFQLAGRIQLLRCRISRILKYSCLFYPALTCIVGLSGFQSNPHVLTYTPLRAIDYHLSHCGAYDILLALWFAAVAYCVGKRFLRLLGLSSQSGLEGLIFPAAAGFALFSWLTMIISLVHGLYRPVAYMLLILPTAIWHKEIRHYPRDLWRALAAKAKGISWSAEKLAYSFIVVYVGAVLVLMLISALGPSLEYDDLNYHLTGPKNYIQSHKLVFLPDIPMLSFPKNIEMLYSLALLWHNDITAKLLHFLLGVGTLLLAYAFCARFISRSSGMVAVAILAATPLFIWEMRTAHVDVGLAFYIFIGAYATILWQRTGESAWMRFAIFCIAFSLGVKYYALLALGLIALLAFIMHLSRFRALAPAACATLKFGFYSLLGLIPWGLVNLYYTGNPFFPLFNGIFRSPYWTDAHTHMMITELFRGGVRISLSNIWDLGSVSYGIATDSQGRFSGNIGPFYILLLPFLLLIPKAVREFWFLFAFSMLYYVGWAISGPLSRFVFPALPGLAAAAALAATNLLRILGTLRRFLAIAAAVILAAVAIWCSPFFERYGGGSRYGTDPWASLPVDYLTGRESRSDYLARFYPGIRAVEFLNKIPGAKKVYYDGATPDGFYLNGKAAYHYSAYFHELMAADADRAHEILIQNGITHVVVGQEDMVNNVFSRESNFVHWYLRELTQINAHIVYEILPARVVQNAVTFDFLAHLSEARMVSQHGGKNSNLDLKVRRIGDDGRYAMVMATPSTAEFQVDVPDHAILSFAVGADNPSCGDKRSFSVWIISKDGRKSLAWRRDIEGATEVGWIKNRVDLSTYAGSRIAIAFEADGVSCSNYFWADPILIAKGRMESDASGDKPVVTGGNVHPAQTRLGDSLTASFYGSGLTPSTCLDVRFRSPGSSSDYVVFNWQCGQTARHEIALSTQTGRWIITGVRAHRERWDHSGNFNPLWITMDVAR
jgi:hypothetical protein